MDILCRYCREPWDTDSLHDEATERRRNRQAGATYQAVFRDFRDRGCVAIGGPDCANGKRPDPIVSAFYDVGGDDIDGIAADLEDAAFLGFLGKGGAR